MQISDITTYNDLALSKVQEYRSGVTREKFGLIDAEFHRYKNKYTYMGFVDAEIFGSKFVMFSANDDLVAMTFFWHGPSAYEPMSMQLWKTAAQESQVVMDVGSFSGVYSLLAATANPRCDVIAIEASRRTYGRLVTNVYANKLERRVKTFCRAASNVKQMVTFKRFRGENILGIGDSFLPKDGLEVQSDDEHVQTITLDQLVEEEKIIPQLIKIDVEGAELLVLDGMQRILSQARPKILIEVTPQTAPEVNAKLVEQGYSVSVVEENSMSLRPFADMVPGVLNFFAEPGSGST